MPCSIPEPLAVVRPRDPWRPYRCCRNVWMGAYHGREPHDGGAWRFLGDRMELSLNWSIAAIT